MEGEEVGGEAGGVEVRGRGQGVRGGGGLCVVGVGVGERA